MSCTVSEVSALFRGIHLLRVFFVLLALVLVSGCGSSGSDSTASSRPGGTYASEEPTPMTSAEEDIAACKAQVSDASQCDDSDFLDCMDNPDGGDETKCSDVDYSTCLSNGNDDSKCSDPDYIECMQSGDVYDETLCDDVYDGTKILLSGIPNPGGGDIECPQLDKPVVIDVPDKYHLDEDGDGVGCEWNDPSAVPPGT